MTLGQKIQLSRKKKGMSQEDLANVLNVSRQAVQKWESDNSTPEINKLIDISNIFEVSLDWLLKDMEEKETNKAQPTSYKDVSTGKIVSIILYSLSFVVYYVINGLAIGFIPSIAYTAGSYLISTVVFALIYSKKFPRWVCWLMVGLQFMAGIGQLVSVFEELAFLYGPLINVFYFAAFIVLYIFSDKTVSKPKADIKKTKDDIKKNLKDAKNLQENYVNDIKTLEFRFLDDQYNPKDKITVRENASQAIYAIRHNVDEKEMKSILSTFDKYLKEFKLDPEYYVEFKKKQKKAYIITGIVVAGLGLLTGLTFATIKIGDTVSTNIETKERYDRACKFMEEGKFYEAGNAYRALGDYKDSKKMRSMCIYLDLIDDGVDLGSISTVKEGIEGIVKLGESVILRYDDKEGYFYYRKNFDEIDYYEVTVTSYPYIDYTPSVIKAGWKFKKWSPDRVFYKENQTYIELSATWEPIIYRIHYELNGGTNDIRNVETYNVATSTITLYSPTRDGWDFLNWTEETTGEIITEIPHGSTGNRNLIANWNVSA